MNEKNEAVEFTVKLSWTCRSLVKQLPLLPPCHCLYNASYFLLFKFESEIWALHVQIIKRIILPLNLWRRSYFEPNRLVRIDFDPKLCTWVQIDPLRTDYKFDSEAMKTMKIATLDRPLMQRMNESLARLWR